MRALRTSLALLLTVGACTCGDEGAPNGDWKALFDTLIRGLPEASSDSPADALPRSIAWVAVSSDPEAWRAWAARQPFAQGLMETPAFEDVMVSRTYLALDGLRRTVSRAAALGGDPDDAHALWRGPTAIGVVDPADPSPSFVAIKRIDPSMRTVVRLAAAFASVEGATEKEVGKIKVRSLDYGGRAVSFAVFRNLLIVGSDLELVERAAGLAQGAPRGDDQPASKDPLLPPADAEGVHLRVDLTGGELASLISLEAVGVSLVMSETAPVVLRRAGNVDPAESALGLLRFAPASTTVAVVDAGAPEATVVSAIERIADGLAEGEASAPSSGKKKGKKKVPSFDGKAMAAALAPGVAIALGARDEAASPAGVGPLVLLAHRDAAALEAPVRALIARLTGQDVTRTVLEDRGGAVLLSADDAKVTAGLTKDVLVLGLSADAVQRALAAGTGQAPSVRDRARIGDNVAASGGVYVDLSKTAAWLTAFYGEAFTGDDAVSAADAAAVLGPTFAALGRGPTLFAALSAGGGEVAVGALEIVK